MLYYIRDNSVAESKREARFERVMSVVKVLVVAKQPHSLELLESNLVKWGYNVTTASNLTEAEQALGREQPDLVLLMMTDLGTTREIWGFVKQVTTPIIFLRDDEIGFSDSLVKLRERIRNHHLEPRLDDEELEDD